MAQCSEHRPFMSVMPATLSWHNITVSANPATKWLSRFTMGEKAKPDPIIKDVSGKVKPGRILAIMGASGAGKTTLLNALNGRNLNLFNVKGAVKINNKVADVKTITTTTAYVQQEDLLWPSMTAREHLVFQAMVRMGNHFSLHDKAKRINQVLRELSLAKCADVQVGGPNSDIKGISGGERKRVSLALEILTNPSILFCDEPTSGLDSFMSEKLIGTLKLLARQGRTILCTIHQPSSILFDKFDDLLLLADGRVAYQGEQSKTLAYFSRLGLKCPTNYNPADFFIRELSIDPGKEAEARHKINMICEYYLTTVEQVDRCESNSFKRPSRNLRIDQDNYTATIWQEFQALGWRSAILTIREPMLTRVRVYQSICMAILLGLIYFQQPYEDRRIMNINGALFILLTSVSFNNTLAVINTFCKEYPVFCREYSNGMYRVISYFTCKNLAEFPLFVLIPIVWVAIYYYMVGFYPHVRHFLLTMLVAILLSAIGVAFGYLVSCLSPKVDIALAILSPMILPLQLLGGFFINLETVSPAFKWVQKISWFSYGFEILATNQWEKVEKIECTNDTSVSGKGEHFFCGKSGVEILDFLGMTQDSFVVNITYLILSNFVIRIMGYLILAIKISR